MAALGLLGFGQKGQPFLVTLQHRVQQGLRAGGRSLPHLRHARAGRQPDIAAVQAKFARDSLEQGGLTGTVAPHQPDSAAGIHRQVGALKQNAAAHAEGNARDG